MRARDLRGQRLADALGPVIYEVKFLQTQGLWAGFKDSCPGFKAVWPGFEGLWPGFGGLWPGFEGFCQACLEDLTP